MKNNLLLDEISRINFLMNYDSSKLITEQKNYNTHRVILIEDNKTNKELSENFENESKIHEENDTSHRKSVLR